MKRTTKAERSAAYGDKLREIFPHATVSAPNLWDALAKLERRASRLAESACNGTTSDVAYERACNRILAELQSLLGDSPALAHVFVNGDPRGFALKIEDEYVSANNLDVARDMGGYGILCPEL
jgi:hypothetical protein